MKIVLWGTYDTSKPRIRILRDGLRACGASVTEIHATVWEDVEDKSRLHATKWFARGLRLLFAYPLLIWRYLRAPGHDLVLVSYPGQLDVLVLRLFAWLRRKPLVFDWFISAYDTVVNDRRLFGPRNPLAWAIWFGEWLAARTAHLAFMDTATHARRMESIFRLKPDSIGHVWVGTEALFFQSVGEAPVRNDGALTALFYGQFIPLHGVDTIIKAARLLRNEPVKLTLIGRGQEAPRIRDMLDADPLANVEWIDWVPYEALPATLANVDVCLGIFGTTDKAASVIPNKVFQIIATGKPLITRDSAAIRELLDDAPPCTRLVTAGDAVALAKAMRECASSIRMAVTPKCHVREQGLISARSLGRQFETLVSPVLRHSRAAQ